MYQLAQILVYLTLYAGLVCIQLTAVERWLRGFSAGQWQARLRFSLAHAAFGYAVFLGVLVLSNVVTSGDYRHGWLDPYGLVLPAGGCVVGASLPWLGLLRGDRRAERSTDYLRTRLDNLSAEDREAICSLFKSGQKEAAVQAAQRVLGVTLDDPTILAKILHNPSAQ